MKMVYRLAGSSAFFAGLLITITGCPSPLKLDCTTPDGDRIEAEFGHDGLPDNELHDLPEEGVSCVEKCAQADNCACGVKVCRAKNGDDTSAYEASCVPAFKGDKACTALETPPGPADPPDAATDGGPH